MKSNLVAAVAGGLVLGAAVFLPMGANAINQEVKQISNAQSKIAAPVNGAQASDELASGDQYAQDSVAPAAIDPIATTDPAVTPTPDPIATPLPTFSGGDDDEDSNDDDGFGDDSDSEESDD